MEWCQPRTLWDRDHRKTRRGPWRWGMALLLLAVSLAARTPSNLPAESATILGYPCLVIAEGTVLSGIDPQTPGLVRGRTQIIEVLRGEAKTGKVDIAITRRTLAVIPETPLPLVRVMCSQSPDQPTLLPLLWCRQTATGGVELLSRYRSIDQPGLVEPSQSVDLAAPLIWLGQLHDGVLHVREERAVAMPDLRAYVKALLEEEPLPAMLRLVADSQTPLLARERAIRYLAGDIPPWPWHGNDGRILNTKGPTIPLNRKSECLDALRQASQSADSRISRQALSVYCQLADQSSRDQALAAYLCQRGGETAYPDIALARHFGSADGTWRQGLRPMLLPGYDPLFAAMLCSEIAVVQDGFDRALLCGMLGDSLQVGAFNEDGDMLYTAEWARQRLHAATGIWCPYNAKQGWEIVAGDARPAFVRSHPVLATQECPFAVTWHLCREPGRAPELVLTMENQANVPITVCAPGITVHQTLSLTAGESTAFGMAGWAADRKPHIVRPLGETEFHLSLKAGDWVPDLPVGEHGLETMQFELTLDRPPQTEGTVWFGVLRHQTTTRF